MHSISDLTTFARKTKGDVPPPVVGASTTVIGNKMILYGGRLVAQRKMTSDLYVFDLQTFIWTKLTHSADEEIPTPRYFHSADTWNNLLIIFGGMGAVSPGSDELCVLSDVRFFSLDTFKWITPISTLSTDPEFVPRARYAHLSSVTASKLFIIGGQDMTNVWLDDIHVFDLSKMEWIERREYPRHCGTYRSVAVSGEMVVRSPMQELKAGTLKGSEGVLGPSGQRFLVDGAPPPSPTRAVSNALVHLPYSAYPTNEHPNDIHIYSNYNFTDVKRELEVFSPASTSFSVTDRSSTMNGSSLPPGLRFPTGAIIGTHLIIAGTYLAHSYQSFSIWALELRSMTWSRIEPGATLSSGSWSRGVLWTSNAKFIVFGNRDGNLVEDYNRRLLNWDHVAYIDLEAFGIYQPPLPVLDIVTQELGLAALEEALLVDFEIVCDDGRKIKCSRKVLEERWPWFREQRKLYLEKAKKALEGIPSTSYDTPLSPTSTTTSESEGDAEGEGSVESEIHPRLDPRLTPRQFALSEPYPITRAFLQYLYTLALLTPLQHAPPVLSALLLMSATYELPHLESLVKHAMHGALSPGNSVGLYEVATLCDCQSLQIRALRVVMSSSKRPSNRRSDPRQNGSGDGGGGRRIPEAGGHRGRSNTAADSLAASSTSSGRTINGNITPVQRTYSTQHRANGVPNSSIRPTFNAGTMGDLHEEEEEDRATHDSHATLLQRSFSAAKPPPVQRTLSDENINFGDALVRTHRLALSSLISPIEEYDDPLSPETTTASYSSNRNGKVSRDEYVPKGGGRSGKGGPMAFPTSPTTGDGDYPRQPEQSPRSAALSMVGSSSGYSGGRSAIGSNEAPSHYSSGSSSRQRSASDVHSRRPSSPHSNSTSNHSRSGSITTPTDVGVSGFLRAAHENGIMNGTISNGTLPSNSNSSGSSYFKAQSLGAGMKERRAWHNNLTIGPAQGLVMAGPELAAARASLGHSTSAAPPIPRPVGINGKSIEKDPKSGPKSLLWRPSKSEEKKRRKEIEAANIARIASEARLRAANMTAPRSVMVSPLDSSGYSSMGGA